MHMPHNRNVDKYTYYIKAFTFHFISTHVKYVHQKAFIFGLNIVLSVYLKIKQVFGHSLMKLTFLIVLRHVSS